jgi:hypothetical protein
LFMVHSLAKFRDIEKTSECRPFHAEGVFG